LSKAAIKEIAFDYKMGNSITKIAKESKFCFRRVRKLIQFLLSLADFDMDIAVRASHVNEAYKHMNAKALLMEEINERQIRVLRCLIFKMGVNKNAKILTKKL
jgi:hypothetical protein